VDVTCLDRGAISKLKFRRDRILLVNETCSLFTWVGEVMCGKVEKFGDKEEAL